MPEVIMPKMGDAMTEGKLLSWLQKDGATVKSGDVIAEIETDKSNVEIEAEDNGVLTIQAQPGDVLPVGAVIALIGENVPAAATPKPAVAQPAAVAAPSPTPAPASNGVETSTWKPVKPATLSIVNGNGQERLKASPLARRVAKEQGVDIAQITGTGPLGRIIEADVQAFLANPPKAATPIVSQPKPAQPAAIPTGTPTELSAMRKVIAKRMVESKTTIPHFYVTSEVDMTEVMVLRTKLNSYDETLTKISLNDMVVKAAAKALVKVPAANAVFQDNKIYAGSGAHVGVAVALDDGLIVPVIRNADQLPLRKLAETSRDLIKKARDKKLQPNDYTGGTFTISNMGTVTPDVENFIAIIDPSQGAILAVASIIKKPVVLEDGATIAVRQRMSVTFSGDHRVMDGATGAKFLYEFKRLLQSPLALLEG